MENFFSSVWHSLPFDVLVTVFEQLHLIDLIGVQDLNAQCYEAVEFLYARRCRTVIISRSVIDSLFAETNYTPHYLERIAFLLSRIGQFVHYLTIDLTTYDLPIEPDINNNINNNYNDQQQQIRAEGILITQLMLRLCPNLKQFSVRRLNDPNSLRKVYRVYNAPFGYLGILQPNVQHFNEVAACLAAVVAIGQRTNDANGPNAYAKETPAWCEEQEPPTKMIRLQ